MFEDLYAPLPQVDAYLARIGYEGPIGLTEACLDQLVLRHQLSVPFENLDIRIRKTPVSLGIPQLFDKVVTRGRGGFCYELNGLFRALLEALGFRAWCCSCKVLKGEGPGHPALHRGVVVDLGGRLRYCDVGFGGPMPAGALPIEAGDEQCIGGDRFGNYEGLLPDAPGREYHECDIDTLHAASRGAKRIVYSNDGLIYYTEDHYESFILLYGEE